MNYNFPKRIDRKHCRFFSAIYVLALACGEESLRRRMTKERHITDDR